MKQSSSIQKNGFLLIEAMVAMTVLMTGVLAVFALMSQSIKLTRTINDQYVATYLAAEGIEVMKNLVDSNVLTNPGAWNAGGFDGNTCYEVDHLTPSLAAAQGCVGTPLNFDGSVYGYGVGGGASLFVRSVEISPIIDGAQIGVRVRSTVEYAGGNSSYALEDTFYAWH